MPLRIGILGAAGIAPDAVIRPARRRRDGTAVVAVASARGRPDRYAAEHEIPCVHDSYRALLADDTIDLVYVALPPSLHAEWSIAALEAGKHVLCEKPFAMTEEQARLVVATAERVGRRAFEAFHDYHHPLAASIRNLVSNGRLGAVSGVEAIFDGPNPFHPRSIRHDPALGGGALMDLGCYPVHWTRTLFGEPSVRRAWASLNPLGADIEFRAELAFPGGVSAVIRSSMADGVELASELHVEGDRGVLHVSNLVFPTKGHSVRLSSEGIDRTWTVAGDETYDHQLSEVIDAIATGRVLATEGAGPIGNLRTIDAIRSHMTTSKP